jgi:hypothetical protein
MKWIAIERLPSSSNRFLLLRRQFIEVAPEFFHRAILITHASGGISFNAVSIDTKRPLSKSSSASIKSSGMLVGVASRMRSTRRCRSDLGKASISFKICSAVIVSIKPLFKRPATNAKSATLRFNQSVPNTPAPATRLGHCRFSRRNRGTRGD